MLQDIFNALASGASQGNNQTQSQSGGDVLSGLLGAVMGGQTGVAAPATGSQVFNQSQSGGSELSGLLGSLLGGQTGATTAAVGSQTTSNPIMNLVSSGQNPMVNTLIQPVVDQIAQRMGISPSIAMTLVTYAVHYMLSNHGTKLAKGEDISGVLQQHTNQDYLHSSGLSKQLANQTGLKPAAAASALSEVFKLLGTSST